VYVPCSMSRDAASSERVRTRLASGVRWIERLIGSRPERLFLIIAVPFGLFFAFFVPPSQVPDEPAHFLRVWKLADGDFVSDYRYDESVGFDRQGGVFDKCVRTYIAEFYAIAATPEPYSVRDYWFDTPNCSPRNRTFSAQDAHGDYGAWSYPGQTAGVAFGRLVGLPLPIVFFLGRLGGLAAFMAAAYTAIRIAPSGKLILFAVAALPISLTAAAGYSTDSVIIGGTLFAVAALLRAALVPGAAHRWTLAAVVALGIVVLTKPPYIPLLALLLVVPATNWSSRRAAWLVRIASVTSILVAVAVWRIVTVPPNPGIVFREGIDHRGQAGQILRNPYGFARLALYTFRSETSQEYVIRGWVGQFGMLRTGRPEGPLFTPIVAMLAAALFGATYATERGPKLRPLTWWSGARSTLVLLVAVATFFAIYAGLFVIWNPIGSQFIEGVQGRYFVPLFLLPALLWGLTRQRSDGGVGPRALALGSAALLMFAVWKIKVYFY
jgi:uncharacterized membrane protein